MLKWPKADIGGDSYGRQAERGQAKRRTGGFTEPRRLHRTEVSFHRAASSGRAHACVCTGTASSRHDPNLALPCPSPVTPGLWHDLVLTRRSFRR